MNFYNNINNETKEIININNNLINIIYKTSYERYLDYEYLISILKENYNKLIFLGNKRNYNSDTINNLNISENSNTLDNLQFINNNCCQKKK